MDQRCRWRVFKIKGHRACRYEPAHRPTQLKHVDGGVLSDVMKFLESADTAPRSDMSELMGSYKISVTRKLNDFRAGVEN